MLGDARQLGGRDNLHLNNNSNSNSSSCTDHPWPTSSSSPYSKLRGFFRKEMGLASSKHKMTCDKKKKQHRGLGLGLAAKEHIVKSQERTGGGGGGGGGDGNNNLAKKRSRHQQTKAPLAPGEEEGHARPDVAGNSCGGGGPKEPSPARRWNRSVGRRGPQKKHCLFVKGRREEECRFVENSHRGQTPDAHPSSRKCSPTPSTTRFKGQTHCGSPVNGRQQQQCPGQERNCVREPLEGEPYGADMPDTGKQDLATHRHLESTLNSDADCEADKSCSWDQVAATKVTKLESLNQSKHSSHSLILSEVPAVEMNNSAKKQQQQQQHQQNCSQMGESTNNSERLASSAALGPKLERETQPVPETQPETRLLWTSRKRRAVRDQIRRVVVELEGILRGLKEVHLEMKEVVQQIELLTSDIDPPGDQPHSGLHGDALGSSRSSVGVTVGGRKGRGKGEVEEGKGEEGGGADLGKADSIPSPHRTTDPSRTNGPVLCNKVADDETQPTGNRIEDCINTLPTSTPESDPPPANQSSRPTKDEGKKLGVKQATLKAAILGPRAKKPPPYPHHHHHTLKTAKAGDKGGDRPKAPPYPVKRRLLSTTV